MEGATPMRAIRIHQFGGPEVLQLEEVSAPEPGEGEARLTVEAVGVNFIDIYHRTGLYPSPLPFTPGMEAAGVVEAVGPGVYEVEVGDRVAYAMEQGSYAEAAVVPAWKLVQLPEGLDAESGAAAMLQGMTAQYLTQSTYPLTGGETVLVQHLFYVVIQRIPSTRPHGQPPQQRARVSDDEDASAGIGGAPRLGNDRVVLRALQGGREVEPSRVEGGAKTGQALVNRSSPVRRANAAAASLPESARTRPTRKTPPRSATRICFSATSITSPGCAAWPSASRPVPSASRAVS